MKMDKVIITYICKFFLAFENIGNLLSINPFKQKGDQSLPEFLPKPGIKGKA